MEATWKRLVEQLSASGFESKYLDRLRKRVPSKDPTGIAAEILHEMASALGRAEDKVNAALLVVEVEGRALDAFEASLGPAPDASRRAEHAARVRAFNEKRDLAAAALWELRVHREAIGFRLHQGLEDLYPIPPRR